MTRGCLAFNEPGDLTQTPPPEASGTFPRLGSAGELSGFSEKFGFFIVRMVDLKLCIPSINRDKGVAKIPGQKMVAWPVTVVSKCKIFFELLPVDSPLLSRSVRRRWIDAGTPLYASGDYPK